MNKITLFENEGEKYTIFGKNSHDTLSETDGSIENFKNWLCGYDKFKRFLLDNYQFYYLTEKNKCVDPSYGYHTDGIELTKSILKELSAPVIDRPSLKGWVDPRITVDANNIIIVEQGLNGLKKYIYLKESFNGFKWEVNK